MKKVSNINNKAVVWIMMILVLAAMVVGIAFAGKQAYAESNFVRETSVAHFSDLHVMPMEYCNTSSEAFQQASVTAAKLMSESEAALQTALKDLYEMSDAPKIVLVSGDVTSNGEYVANRRVAEILKEFTKKMRTRSGYESFQIFLLPGNHDLYNEGAVTYMPTKEELDSCADDAERLELMTNYQKRSVATTTNKDVFELYADFGYCNCPGRKTGHHEASCGMAEGTILNFFYESEYWYDKTTTRKTVNGETVYTGFDTMVPSKQAIADYKANGKDFEYLAKAGRIGLCSYVATLNGVTVVCVDGNARDYVGIPEEGSKKYEALKSGGGWRETTGGMTTRDQLRWIVDETKEEVKNNNLMLLNCHFNNMAHFDAQDEVISLFVLDNYELYNSTLAPAGFRYSFSGHQHAFDIADYVTQDGSVIYDFETGSLISYGSGFRVVDFKQVMKNGNYYEEVKSTVPSLDYNDNLEKAFYYGEFKLTSELTENDLVWTVDPVAPSIFEDTENIHLYEGTEYLSLVRKTIKDKSGNNIGLGTHLTDFFVNQLTGVVGNFVNDGLYDMIKGATEGLQVEHKFLYDFLGGLIDDLSEMDLPKFVDNGNGTFSITKNAVKGNDLVDVAKAMVDFLFEYDLSYGTEKGGTTLNDLFVEIYGGHLTGAQKTVISDIAKPLLEKLDDGTFVRFLIGLLAGTIVPQLDYLFDAPIRFDASTPELPEGVGFDISQTLKGSAKSFSVDIMVKLLLNKFGLKNPDKNGYSSLRIIIGNIAEIATDVLITDESELTDNDIKLLATIARPLLGDMLSSVEKYVYLGIEYIKEYEDDSTLYEVLQKELIDKYVTDAFCRNLGNYVIHIVSGIIADDMPDGSYRTKGDIMTEYNVANYEKFNITTTKYNASEVFQGKAYYRSRAIGDKLAVVATEENGLLPSMISVSFNKDLTNEKKIRWFTSIDRSVWDKNDKGEYEFSTPVSYIEYSTDKNLKDAVRVKANTVNVDRELPTVDLGIMYFNLSHRYRLYNDNTVTLTGLKEGTTYYYRLGNDDYAWTEIYSFTTEGKKGSFSFMAITDIQGSVEKNYTESYPNLKKATEYFGDKDIAFIASMGDNVDNGKNILQYTWWLDDQKDVWADNTLVTLAGNHEKKNYALSSVIAVPDNAEVNATGYYYSYDYGYAHFIVLDTNDLESNQLSEKQTEWLLQDLKDNAENEKTTWTIVMLHKGPYTAGSHAFDQDVIALRKQLTPIFADNGVDLVLQGHDHTYSVSEYIGADGKPIETSLSSGTVRNPEGVLYVNLGTMGDKFYDYIYSDEVTLMKRTSVDKKISQYLTKEGNLELTETPVFADITVEKGKLIVKTFTIIDGEVVEVDDITVKKSVDIVDWSNLTPTQIATIASVVAGVTLIIVLCVLGISARKRRNQWKQ